MKDKQTLVLAISHNIYLTADQRATLVEGKPIEVIGVSLPIWHFKGISSEPGVEVFGKYYLTNDIMDLPITTTKQGYQINMPQLPTDWIKPAPLPDELWRMMKIEEQEDWYLRNSTPPTAENLKDINDGGSEYLYFEQYNKVKKSNRWVDIAHFVEIKTVERLQQTLVT